MESAASENSLSGIRVVDLSRVLAGPFCGALLADLGADVIKVEDTQGGDEVRTWPPFRQGEAAAFLVNNRNKKSVAVDLREPEGAGIVRRLVRKSDVLIENFRTGAMEKFGLGYEALSAENPGLIYCSISAFGRKGPRSEEAGYESLLQAFCGIMSITGEPDEKPLRVGPSFLDLGTGVLCAFGIMNALFHRARTGLGQRVDGSLFQTALGMLNYQAENYLLTGNVPKALGSGHASLCPYRNFQCRDRQWIFLAGANDRLWNRIANVLGLKEMLEDPRYSTNGDRVKHRDEVDIAVQKAVAAFDREDLLHRLEKAGAPAAPVNTVDEVLRDRQTEALGMIRHIHHPKMGEVPLIGFPLEFSRFKPGIYRPSPKYGEHTDEVLLFLGYSQTEINRLRNKKIII